ncbi:hypothetical protein ACFSGX_14090 [Sphingomonas arantia]|uniref:Uncharacterized protein n=1 Tax=Sphingomonas arantia TaxID=1460676 RepID=A0ABW4TYU3_9SPHN
MTDGPRLRHEWTFLAQVATDIHGKRAATYPAHVAGGRMSQADADTALASIAAIAADWRIAADGIAPLSSDRGVSRSARIATLTIARDRSAALADKAATAYRKALPAKADLPDRDPLLSDHREDRPMSSVAEAWVRAVDYAAAVAAMLWWEERRSGRLDVVCAINAELRAAQRADQAKAA